MKIYLPYVFCKILQHVIDEIDWLHQHHVLRIITHVMILLHLNWCNCGLLEWIAHVIVVLFFLQLERHMHVFEVFLFPCLRNDTRLFFRTSLNRTCVWSRKIIVGYVLFISYNSRVGYILFISCNSIVCYILFISLLCPL